MASKDKYLYDDVKADWFKIALESDITDSKNYVNDNFLKISDVDDSKTFMFIVQEKIIQGIQKAHVLVPFNCVLESIDASVMGTGVNDLEVQIQKSIDFTNWTDVLDSPVTIVSGTNKETVNTFSNTITFTKGDILILNVLSDSKSENLSLNINVTKQ